MSKIIPVILLAGLLGVLSGCASQPQANTKSQQEQLAAQQKAAAEAEAARKDAAQAREEAARAKNAFRKGLKK